MAEVAEEYVEGDGGTGVAEVRIAVDGRAADVHAHVGGVERLEEFLMAGEGVIDDEVLFHKSDVFCVALMLGYRADARV